MRRPWLMAMAWPILVLWHLGPVVLTSVVRGVTATTPLTATTAPVAASTSTDGNKNTVTTFESKETNLRITLTTDSMTEVPSCHQRKAPIRLENVHSSETVLIHSIQIEGEETLLLQAKDINVTPKRRWNDWNIPQQFHIANDQGGISLGPGRSAIIPYHFVPRYPNVDFDAADDPYDMIDQQQQRAGIGRKSGRRYRYRNPQRIHTDHADRVQKEDGQSPQPTLSREEYLDLVNLLGFEITNTVFHTGPLDQPTRWSRYDYPYNNIDIPSLIDGNGDLYKVSATVVLETSKGSMRFPISATTVRDNEYGIPDLIEFSHPSYSVYNDEQADDNADYDEPQEQKNWIDDLRSLGGFALDGKLEASDVGLRRRYEVESSSGSDNTQRRRSRDSESSCFAVHISNPRTDEALHVLEVSISEPDLMTVHFDAGLLLEDPRTTIPTQSSNDGPMHIVQDWTLNGPLTLPPGTRDAYLVSVCARTHELSSDDVNHERPSDLAEKGWPWDAGNPDRDLGLMSIRTDNETLVVFLEHSDFVHLTETNNSGELESPSSEASVLNPGGPQGDFLQTTPEILHVWMVSETSPPVDYQFGLKNDSPEPIRIMRAAVLLDAQDGKHVDVTEWGLNISISLNANDDETEAAGGTKSLGHLVLDPSVSVEEMFTVTCSVDPSSSLLADGEFVDVTFNGKILVRGTFETDMPYEEWKDDMRLNPYRDDHVLGQLPFTVNIISPVVEAIIERSTHPYPQLFASQGWDSFSMAVSFLFFPMTAFDAMEGTEEPLPTQTYVGSKKLIHDLRIISNVPGMIKLEGGRVVDKDPDSVDSLCARFNVTKLPDHPEDGFARIGHLSLVYQFDILKRSETQQTFMFPRTADDMSVPKNCILEIVTTHKGKEKFEIPIVIFPGHLDLSNGEGARDDSSMSLKMGFDHLVSWAKSSGPGSGKILVDKLAQSMVGRGKDKNDVNLLASYVRRLSHHKWRKTKSRFHPIMLNIGTIDNGKVVKAPLYFTNLNPVPIRLSIDVGAVEGMSISLSRVEGQSLGDGNSLLDGLPTYTTDEVVDEGDFNGHPISGLLEFLSSNEKALAFTSSFNFREAVDFDSDAVQRFPFLRFLYEWYSSATFHKSQSSNRLKAKSDDACGEGFPPDYISADRSDDARSNGGKIGAVILSSDGKLVQPLMECMRRDFSNNQNEETVKIPPGSRARLEIEIRGPPQNFLESDISNLLSTGLLLSTNFGDIMPIFVEFEALQGQLYGSFVDKFGSESSIYDAPLRLSWSSENTTNTSSVDTIRKKEVLKQQDQMVPLLLRSTFTSEIRLQKIESCNPWFVFSQIELGGKGSSQSKEHVGHIGTNIDCSDSSQSVYRFPSYFQCALNWLNERAKLQPDGCGQKTSQDSVFKHTHLEKVRRSVERANRAIRKEYNDKIDLKDLSPAKAIRTGRKRRDGLVKNLDLFAVAINNLKVATEHGVNTLTTSLRATIEYKSIDSMLRQNLTLAVRNVMASAILKPPRLFVSENSEKDLLRLSDTSVGSLSSAYIPIRNPTTVPIRVRLAVGRNTTHSSGKIIFPPFVHTKNTTYLSEWWSGNGNFYLHDIRGDVVRSHHNITIKAGPGAHVSLVNPSLHSQTVLLMGCGVRCGLRGDDNPLKDDASPHKGTTAPIGAASASGVTLSGCTWTTTSDERSAFHDPILWSAGPGMPHSGGPSPFAIPYSALEEVVVPPFGTADLGPILFRPPGRYPTSGCDLATESGVRYTNTARRDLCSEPKFDSLLYLENSLTGVESISVTAKSRWTRLVFLDAPGGSEDAYSDIELIDGMETLMFAGLGHGGVNSIENGFPASKEVLIHNAGDAVAYVSRVFVSDTRTSGRKVKGSCNYGSFRLAICPLEPFRLKPGESRGIVIDYIPRCIGKKEFVVLTVEISDDPQSSSVSAPSLYDSKRGSRAPGFDSERPFRVTTFSLSVGYRGSDESVAGCVPISSIAQKSIAVGSNFGESPNAANETGPLLRPVPAKREGSFLLPEIFLLMAAVGLLCFNTRIRFHERAESIPTSTGKVAPKKVRSHWNAAFRCFARADPGASELQALGKEQMRQVVISHYKAKGTTPPAALTNANMFSRDRRGIMSAQGRQRSAKDNSGNERIRTLSDALFQDAPAVSDDSTLRNYIPVGLGWRTASSRGVVSANSSAASMPSLTSKVLLQKRVTGYNADRPCDDDIDLQPSADDDVETYHSDGSTSHSVDKSSPGIPRDNIERRDANPVPAVASATAKANGSLGDTVLGVDTQSVSTKARDRAVLKADDSSRDLLSQTDEAPNGSVGTIVDEKNKNNRHPNDSAAVGGKASRAYKQLTKSTRVGDQSIGNKDTEHRRGSPGKQEFSGVSSKRGNTNETGEYAATSANKKNDQRIIPKQKGQSVKTSLSKRGRGDPSTTSRVAMPAPVKDTPRSDKKSKTKSKEKVEKQTPVRQKKRHVNSKEHTNPSLENTEPKDHSSGPVSTPSPIRPPPGLAPPPGFGSAPSQTPGMSTEENNVLLASPTKVSQTANHPTLETMLNSALSNPDVDLNAAAASFHPQSISGVSPATSAPADATSSFADSAVPMYGGSELLLPLSESPDITNEIETSAGDNNADALLSSVLPGLVGTTTMDPPESHAIPTTHHADMNTSQPSYSAILDTESKSRPENGFDVMDFLDSILNEGSLRSEDDERVNEVQPLPILTAVATGVSDAQAATPTGLTSPSSQGGISRSPNQGETIVGPSASSSAPILENPWASEGISRATAYGISFDDEEDERHRGPVASRGHVVGGANDGRDNDDGRNVIPTSPIFGSLPNIETDGSSFYATANVVGTSTESSNQDPNAIVGESGGLISGFADLPLLTPAALLHTSIDRDEVHEEDEGEESNLLSSFYAFGGQQDVDEGED